MKHPSLEYLLVACVAAVVTFLFTPIARRVAIRIKAVARPRDRDVHAVAIPRMGGVALFLGFALALYVASRLPTLQGSFSSGGPELGWVVAAAALICALGVLDDRYELDSLTKLAGQVAAAGLMVTLGGVQIAQVYVPWGDNGTVVLGTDLAIPVTILFTVLIINALNFIDGLDGLAGGVTVIAAGAFFVYSYHVGQLGFTDIVSPATLLAAVLAGTCLGFLPHNFHPARIFMGDSGSMVLGLLLAAATTTSTTLTDPQLFRTTPGPFGSLPLLLGLIVPATVLALPFVDLVLAVFRRARRGRSPFAPDKLHLHHRLLEMGHTHRRAVLLLYFWSALLSFGGVGLSFRGGQWIVLTVLAVLAVVGVLVSVVPRRRRASPAPTAVTSTSSRSTPKAASATASTTAPTPASAAGSTTTDPIPGAARRPGRV